MIGILLENIFFVTNHFETRIINNVIKMHPLFIKKKKKTKTNMQIVFKIIKE